MVTIPLLITYNNSAFPTLVDTMSSLKKYAFTPTLPAIALQDFSPNAELFYYDLNAARATDTGDNTLLFNHRTTSPHDHLGLTTYVITHTITFPSYPFGAVRQESRMPMPEDYDRTPNNPTLPPDVWLLTQHDRTLVKGGLRIALTTIESALIKKMLHHEERVVSKEELIRNIGREPDLYRGLEMCLSRLQQKFKQANDGERLFRAVRNRGYCLTQKIKKPLEQSQTRR
ncbi:DNA-binding winged helix-turn-helix (wHTH) protein [Pseudomonas lurida]|nr:DNA-binding winged helix-turn-helix (wHTH) protein [Pseudomonas lurida]